MNQNTKLLRALAVALEDRQTWLRVARWNRIRKVKAVARLLAETYPLGGPNAVA